MNYQYITFGRPYNRQRPGEKKRFPPGLYLFGKIDLIAADGDGLFRVIALVFQNAAVFQNDRFGRGIVRIADAEHPVEAELRGKSSSAGILPCAAGMRIVRTRTSRSGSIERMAAPFFV